MTEKPKISRGYLGPTVYTYYGDELANGARYLYIIGIVLRKFNNTIFALRNEGLEINGTFHFP